MSSKPISDVEKILQDPTISITSISIDQPFQNKMRKQTRETSALSAVYEHWKSVMPEYKGVPWSQTRPDLVKDFVLAMVEEFKLMYANEAPSRALLSLVVSFAQTGHLSTALNWAFEKGSKDFVLSMTVNQEPELDSDQEKSDSNKPVVEIEVSPRENSSQSNTDWAKFDVLKDVPEESIIDLVSNLESKVEKNDIALLSSAAALLLVWEKMVELHADDFKQIFHEVSYANQPIAAGKQVVVQANLTYPKQVPTYSNHEKVKL